MDDTFFHHNLPSLEPSYEFIMKSTKRRLLESWRKPMKSKKRRVLESPLAEPSFAEWESSSSESEIEDFYYATELIASNLAPETTQRQLKRFFNAVNVLMGEDEEEDPEENPEENPEEDPEEGETMKVARIWFKSLQARKEALKRNGEEVNGVPIRLVRAANHRIVLLVRGLDPEKSESDIKAQLTKHFDSCGGIKKIFIPKDENGRCLSFGYVFMVQEGHKAEMKDSSVMEGGGVIRVSDCTLQARFKKIKEKMEAEGWVNSEEEEEEEDEEDGIVFGDEEIEDDDSE
ncbi:hypothetical protein Bca4012_029090 [Brassica carinata]